MRTPGRNRRPPKYSERDSDADRKPDDRRDRAGELQGEAELGGAVVQGDERGQPEQIADGAPRKH